MWRLTSPLFLLSVFVLAMELELLSQCPASLDHNATVATLLQRVQRSTIGKLLQFLSWTMFSRCWNPSFTLLLLYAALEVSLKDALLTYADDFPSPELFEFELRRWKWKFQDMPEEERPSSPAQAIKVCDPNYFPNVRVLLQIACTLPVTSCECEQSASALRRLHNYMQASMGAERLSSLALLHVHYNTTVDLDEAVDIFSRLHSRRMELESLIKP